MARSRSSPAVPPRRRGGRHRGGGEGGVRDRRQAVARRRRGLSGLRRSGRQAVLPGLVGPLVAGLGQGPTLAWIRRSTWNRRSQATMARPVGDTAIVGYRPLPAITSLVAPRRPYGLIRRARTLSVAPLSPLPCQTMTPPPLSSTRTVWSRPYVVTRTAAPTVPPRVIRRTYMYSLGNRSQVSSTSPSRSPASE